MTSRVAAAEAAVAGGSPASPPGEGGHDAFIDLVRAFSLVAVVVWHWAFTIIRWTPEGPTPTSPLEFTKNLWFLTWLLQVMPLFFFVGGFAHRVALARARAAGRGYRDFILGRVRRLLVPCIALLATWAAVGALIVTVLGQRQGVVQNAILLIVSPLWFIAVYLCLVLLVPPMLWLHERLGPVVIAVLAGLVGIVDVVRFAWHVDQISILNLILVWALCHQLGFFYGELARTSRQWQWTVALGGLLALAGLVLSKVYPPSMVGVPGDRISNMSPPTLCIVALAFFQVGVLMLARPWVVERLRRAAWSRTNEVVNRFALPLFLFHTTGLALAFALLYGLGYRPEARPTVSWWLERPTFLLLPLACTLPVIYLFGRRWVRPPRSREAGDPRENQSSSPVGT